MNGTSTKAPIASSSSMDQDCAVKTAAVASENESIFRMNSIDLAAFGNEGYEVRYLDEKVGKGVFATKKFSKGDLVLVDSPIVTCQFAWNKQYKYRACEYCLRALETAEQNVRRLTQNQTLELPHPECCETKPELHVKCDKCPAEYCSEDCRRKAFDEYHKILCYCGEEPQEPVRILDEYWRKIHYPPETGNVWLLVKLLARIHLDSSNTIARRLSEFCNSTTSDDEELAHKSLGEEFSVHIHNLRELVVNAMNYPNVQQWLTPEGFLKLFVLIGRNAQGVGTSSFATYVEQIEKLELHPNEKKALLDHIDNIYGVIDAVVGHFLDNEGVALYPLQSWVNHSCVPNCEVKFPNKNHVVGLVASRDIEAGEEIEISYLDLADMQRSRYSRNKYLKEHYLFECKCPKCMEQINDEEISTDEDEDDDDEDMSDAEAEEDEEMNN
ncbi:unnamed protein product [Orchesella dallaii]|uniref:SET domain-containing protein n=1 Tax=Orchesella dallaii TaxID=48710 RepID=A0ABP1QQC0_9HEXA